MKNESVQILRDVGLKVTRRRLLILEAFREDCSPINVEFISKKLKSKNINQVTIYRTLASLEKSGIISRVDLRKDSAYYELRGDHHHHIVCTSCDTIENVHDSGLESVLTQVSNKSKLFKYPDHSLEFFGICKKCLKS